jgi:hypothetical protein
MIAGRQHKRHHEGYDKRYHKRYDKRYDNGEPHSLAQPNDRCWEVLP